MLHLRGLHPAAIVELLGRRSAVAVDEPLHVFLCVADHFEPMWAGAPGSVQRERVARWVREYPPSVAGLEDSLGRPPRHTWFSPAEAYDAEHLEQLAVLCHRGFGDVEVHLHHEDDTADGLRETLETFLETLHHRHGLLCTSDDGTIRYAFVHGNWALDNSHPDGRWCGVNNELTVLRETGCYADLTMPSAPSATQTRTINRIYYAIDDPSRPKSHDRGVAARVGATPPDDGLLLIQGPLVFDWSRRRFGLLPRLENADLTLRNPPSMNRLRRWIDAGVTVAGRPNWRFVKLHTHGAKPDNADMLLGPAMRAFHGALAEYIAARDGWRYYYVTAREMAGLVHQAERGIANPVLDANPAVAPM